MMIVLHTGEDFDSVLQLGPEASLLLLLAGALLLLL